MWRRERDSNPRYALKRTHAFQACDLNHSSTSPSCAIIRERRLSGREDEILLIEALRLCEAMSSDRLEWSLWTNRQSSSTVFSSACRLARRTKAMLLASIEIID